MPMRKGSSQRTISKNIKEFHGGKTYKQTEAKFGKKTADRQAIAAALNTARKSGTSKKRNEGVKRRKPLTTKKK